MTQLRQEFFNYILIASIFLISIVAYNAVIALNFYEIEKYGNATNNISQFQLIDGMLDVSNKLMLLAVAIVCFAFGRCIYSWSKEFRKVT